MERNVDYRRSHQLDEGRKSMSRCLLCGSDKVFSVIRVDKVPYSSQSIYKNRADAINCNAARLDIVMCGNCSLVYNKSHFGVPAYDESHGGKEYYYSVSCSDQAKEYQKRLVEQIDRYVGFNGKNVLEIGCGDGFFLNEAAKRCNKAIGFEPSNTVIQAQAYFKEIKLYKLYNKYFDPSRSVVGEHIDLFILRHVLEHIGQPYLFIRKLNGLFNINQRLQHLFVEVPEISFLLANNMYFDFYYDHIFYFTNISLTHLLNKAGWGAIGIINNGGEFLRLIASNGSSYRMEGIPTDQVRQYAKIAADFGARFSAWREKLDSILLGIKRSNQTIAAWGAGSRGVTLLASILGHSDQLGIEYIVDTDKNKDGHYAPMIGCPIFTPGILENNMVDYILVTSFTYFNEIYASLEKYRARGLKIIKVYPEIEVLC